MGGRFRGVVRRRGKADATGVFVFLPLVLPLTAWPVARPAEHHPHPRTATRMLTAVAAVLALCSTLRLALLMVVGTAQLLDGRSSSCRRDRAS